ncbi:MAG: hypothetical protein U0R80_14285 [Nocardioidaceae bacterium]
MPRLTTTSASHATVSLPTVGRAEGVCATLAECELGVAQRLALMALRRGVLVRDLPEGSMVGETPLDRAYAEFVLVHLHRYVDHELAEDDILRAFAEHPLLLAAPDPDHVTHDCPICGRPALYSADRVTVCDTCSEQARCSSGHLVTGWSADAWGEFVAYHVDVDAHEECHSVTDSGRCWIGDCECQMTEARTGGVHVEVVDPV